MSSIFLGMTVIHRRNEKQMLCKIWARVFVCFDGTSVVVNNSGGSRGGARGARPFPPLVLDQTEALRAEKKFFPDHPPLSKGQDDRPPLSQGLDPALNKLVIEGLNCTKLPKGEIGSQSENSIYFSLRTCESRHIILSLWRLGGDLIHFFTDFYNFSFCYLFFTSPVYHYTRFWNLIWELGVKLVVCSLDSLSCRIISRNWSKSGADVFQVYSIFV